MAEFGSPGHSSIVVADKLDIDLEVRIEVCEGQNMTWLSVREVKALRKHLKQVIKEHVVD